MKILQIHKLYYPVFGGIERHVQLISEGLRDRAYIEVLVCKAKGRGDTRFINDVKVHYASSLGMYTGMPISITFPFLLRAKSRRADILHFHLPFPLADLSYVLMTSKGKRVIVTYHSDIVRQKGLAKLYKPFLHQFLRRADRIIVTSRHLLESSEHLTPYKDKCVVIPLSIDLTRFKPPRNYDSHFEHRDASRDKRIVLFVGCLTYYKGLRYLIDAMPHVEARLLIVGNGELRNHLEQQCRSLGVDGRVTFLGNVSDDSLGCYYRSCDVFVLPSTEKSEAFGLVQLEAMAHGKPVVNTYLPTAVPHVSIHGKTGITVPPKDSKALAEAINVLLGNQELAARFSRNAINRVKTEFSQDVMLNRIYSIYRELCQEA